jgi:hypothetical protein
MNCRVCKNHEAEWSWQPWGPGNERDTFTLPGSHYRGFPVVKVCSECKEQIRQGKSITVSYRGREVCVNGNG